MTRERRIWFVLLAGVVSLLAGGACGEARAQSVASFGGVVRLKKVSTEEVPFTKGLHIASGDTIMTAQKSSAVVSLGKLGRVEVLPETNMKLTYDDSGFTAAMLSQGRVRLSSSSGVSATATTEQASIVSSNRGAAEFLVDTTCGNSFVAVKKGSVELRAGNSVKQIAAGSQDSAGQARPGCTPKAN